MKTRKLPHRAIDRSPLRCDNRYSPFAKALVSLVVLPVTAFAQTPIGSAFSYQGQIELGGAAVDENADFEFTLWDDPGTGDPPTGGNQVGPLVQRYNRPVVDGLFDVMLDFGADAFQDETRWVQIAVRLTSTGGAFTTLTPRQRVLATPFSLATRGLVVHADGNVEAAGNITSGGKMMAGAYASTSPFIMEAPAGTERARISDVNGFVGINETTPQGRLHVTTSTVPQMTNAPTSFENDLFIEDTVPWLSLYGRLRQLRSGPDAGRGRKCHDGLQMVYLQPGFR